MFDIFGSPDHLTETGVATSTTAPIKVAPIKSIFRIVVLLYLALLMLSIRSFADADCSKLNSEQAAMVFNIEHPAHTYALKISVLLRRAPQKRTNAPTAFMSTRPNSDVGGSLAIFTAIRRASSFVSSLGFRRTPNVTGAVHARKI
jgi:hypothetical protein